MDKETQEKLIKSIMDKTSNIIKTQGKTKIKFDEVNRIVNETFNNDEIRFMAINDFLKCVAHINTKREMIKQLQQNKKQMQSDMAFQ